MAILLRKNSIITASSHCGIISYTYTIILMRVPIYVHKSIKTNVVCYSSQLRSFFLFFITHGCQPKCHLAFLANWRAGVRTRLNTSSEWEEKKRGREREWYVMICVARRMPRATPSPNLSHHITRNPLTRLAGPRPSPVTGDCNRNCNHNSSSQRNGNVCGRLEVAIKSHLPPLDRARIKRVNRLGWNSFRWGEKINKK